MPLARHLTIRNVAPDLSKAIEEERKRRGTSLNRTVLDMLRRAAGLASGPRYSNGLAKLAGGWSRAEFERFERDTAFLEQIDEELWR